MDGIYNGNPKGTSIIPLSVVEGRPGIRVSDRKQAELIMKAEFLERTRKPSPLPDSGDMRPHLGDGDPRKTEDTLDPRLDPKKNPEPFTRWIGNFAVGTVLIDGEPTKCLLDQGAQSSLVTPEYVKRRGLKVGPLHHLVDGTLELTGVGNIATNAILGYTIFKVEVKGIRDCHEEHIALVVPDDSQFAKEVPIILGTNVTRRITDVIKESEYLNMESVWADTKFNEMLQTRKAAVKAGLISCGKQLLAKSGQILAPPPAPLNPKPAPEKIDPKHKLRTTVAIDIPPFSSHIVKTKAQELPRGEGETVKILVEPIPADQTTMHPAVRVQPCYNELNRKNKKVPVYIVNRTGKNRRIPKGTVVAYAAEVDYAASTQDLKPTHEPEGSTKPQQDHEERLKRLFELLDLSHLKDWPEAEKKKAKDLMAEYSDIFALHELELGQTTGVTHAIHTTSEVPIKERYRHIPKHRMDEVRVMIEEMLRIGVIKESKSPWCNAVVLARKKNGDLRLCIDFRKLNERTVKDAYPLPRIKEALDNIRGACIFTSLDLKQGFWEVPMDEKSKAKTAFTVGPLGFYEFERMPFGLCNAPATFQRLMEACLGELVLDTCLIYVDDIIVFAKTENAHLARLRAVFDRIRAFGLKMRPHKCTFFTKSVDYLGHHISEAGIQPDERHIQRVKEFQPPSTVTEVRQFLGFVNHYRRFIKDYSKKARALQKYTAGDLAKEKNQPIKLTPEAVKSFEILRDACITSPVLAFADYTKPFLLETDASKEALGAVLKQKQPDGVYKPVAYGSRTTSAGEKNYHSSKLEFLALKWAITDEFRDYLIIQPFIVRTDNNPLTYIFTTPHLDAVGHRWVEKMAGFNFEIEYVKGKSNGAADALSRLRRLSVEDTQALLSGAMMNPTDRAENQRPETTELYERLVQEGEMESTLAESESADQGENTTPEGKSTDAESESVYTESEIQPRKSEVVLTADEGNRGIRDSPSSDVTFGSESSHLRVCVTQPMRILSPDWKVEQFKDPALRTIKTWLLTHKNHQHTDRKSRDALHINLMKFIQNDEAKLYMRNLTKFHVTGDLLYRQGELQTDNTRHPQFVVPEHFRKKALQGCHADAGHQGQNRTLSLLQERFWWPNMTNDCREAVKSCQRCAAADGHQDKAPLCPIQATHPMELVHIDVVGIEKQPDAIKSGTAKVLVVTDHFTRFTQAFLIENEQAATIAGTLWAGFLSYFGAPARLISDQGRNFEGKIIAELCKLLGVEKVRTTPYHPQGNGQVERANQTLIRMLRKLDQDKKREWYNHLPTLTHAYNCTRSAITGYSPYYLMFGRRPRTSVDLYFPTVRRDISEKNYKRYVSRLKLDLQDAFKAAETTIAKEADRQKRYYDTTVRGVVLKEGDIVQLAVSAAHGRRKIRDRWEDTLYKVTQVSTDIPVIEITPYNGGDVQRVHRNRLRLIRQGTSCVPVNLIRETAVGREIEQVVSGGVDRTGQRLSRSGASTTDYDVHGTDSTVSNSQPLTETPRWFPDSPEKPGESAPDWGYYGQASTRICLGPGQTYAEEVS